MRGKASCAGGRCEAAQSRGSEVIAKAWLFLVAILCACLGPQFFKQEPNFAEAFERAWFICVGALVWHLTGEGM